MAAMALALEDADALSVGAYLTEWLAHVKGRVRPTTYEGYEALIRCHVALMSSFERLPLSCDHPTLVTCWRHQRTKRYLEGVMTPDIGAVLLFHSILEDLALIGSIGTFVFVYSWFRFKRLEVVPVWWWLASAIILAIVGLVGSGISAGRGLAIILSGVALGIGVQRLIKLWRSGELRLGPPPHSSVTIAEWEDWANPAFHIVGLTTLHLNGLDEENPYFDISVTFINGTLFVAQLQSEIRGRMVVDHQELNQQPDFLQLERSNTVQPLLAGAEWDVQRNERVTITLRQHVLPAVADRIRTRDVSLSFDRLDIGLCLTRSSPSGSELGDRQRLPIPTAYTW